MRCNAMIDGRRSKKMKKNDGQRGGTKRSEMSLEAMLERLSIRAVRQGRERVQDG